VQLESIVQALFQTHLSFQLMVTLQRDHSQFNCVQSVRHVLLVPYGLVVMMNIWIMNQLNILASMLSNVLNMQLVFMSIQQVDAFNAKVVTTPLAIHNVLFVHLDIIVL
jgi:hypothetical protein